MLDTHAGVPDPQQDTGGQVNCPHVLAVLAEAGPRAELGVSPSGSLSSPTDLLAAPPAGKA